MKKIYITPATETVSVQTISMIATSLGSLGENGGTVGTNDTELEDGISSDSRRRGGLWDDED